MPADYLQLHVLFEHAESLDATAILVATALDVELVRNPAEGFPDDRSQDRYEGTTLGMTLSLRCSDRPSGRRYRLTGVTRSSISAGAEGRVSLDGVVVTLLKRSGLDACTLTESQARKPTPEA